ncbi:hypothetical protein JNW88_23240 [Micromonospora sp. ATA32]|nr:hypothetical protein [Micromonospora sp. ATA32]
MVLRPGLAIEHGQWVQREPAGVVLPDHVPADPAARTAFVDRQLGDAWGTLHRELHHVLDRPVAPVDSVPDSAHRPATPDVPTRPEPTRPAEELSLAALEEPVRPDPPVLDADRIGFRDATATDPAPPRPLTPESVRGLLADGPGTPEQVRNWAREHLAVRQEDGSFAPRSQPEIDATVARLRDEAASLVEARRPADPTLTEARPGEEGSTPDRVGDGRPPTPLAEELPVVQELAPSANFPEHRTRTGAELPEQVHELVHQAKENLLARYPEAAVARRVADLDAIGGLADRLQSATDGARESGRLGEVVQRVRDLSRAVNDYADRYRDWRDFERGGEYADPGWKTSTASTRSTRSRSPPGWWASTRRPTGSTSSTRRSRSPRSVTCWGRRSRATR